MKGKLQTVVVGSRHHLLAPNTLSKSKDGDELTLRREPDNVHDKNAVSVWKGDRKLGYIPAADAPAVAKALDTEGLECKAVIHQKPPRVLVTWRSLDEEPDAANGWGFLS